MASRFANCKPQKCVKPTVPILRLKSMNTPQQQLETPELSAPLPYKPQHTPEQSETKSAPTQAQSVLAEAEREAIWRVVKSLKPDSPVRRPAEDILTGRMPDTLQPFLDAIDRKSALRWREREVAVWALGQVLLSPEQTALASEALSNVLNTRHRSVGKQLVRRPMAYYLKRMLPIAICAFLTIAIAVKDPYAPFNGWLAALSLGLIAYFFTYVWFASLASSAIDILHSNRVRARAAGTLTTLDVPESAPVLASAAVGVSVLVQEAARQGLRTVLPKLTQEHCGTLGTQFVPDLCRLVHNVRDDGEAESKLLIAIMNALATVGDARALHDVAHTLEQAQTEAVREAARTTFAILQERQARETDVGVLLRAVFSQNTERGILLRPAQGAASEDDANQLLRADVQ